MRSSSIAPGIAAACLALAATAHAAPGTAGAAAGAGQWDLSLVGSHRKCRITLADEPARDGRAVRFPATCRRALPILNEIAAWVPGDGRSVRLLGRDGKPALRFESSGDGLAARLLDGDLYRLEPAGKSPDRARAPTAPLPPPPGVPRATAVDPATAPPPETLPGTYAIDRYQDRDVCRLVLDASRADAQGHFAARLAEGCRDSGIAIFDPAGWRYESGRLTLYARRGHAVTLISERDGRWRRDPEVGATLILRKVEER